MIRFIKLNSSRYISASKFSLIKYREYYQILMNSKIPKWNYKFSSVECAENFLNSHDYVNATLRHMPMSSDDIEFIIDMYGFENTGHNRWKLETHKGDLSLRIGPKRNQISIYVDDGGLFKKKYTFDDASDVIDLLDTFQPIAVELSCIVDNDTTTQICAASRSLREITKNLVRVKSSNIWAYGIDIRDRHDKTGNVFVQFKGKNGGPTGGLYVYYDVPITIWRGWVAAPSKGNYLWRHIRNTYYYSKLDGDKRGKLRNAVNH